jgi:cytochrome c oxidase cbb3-type subunit 4
MDLTFIRGAILIAIFVGFIGMWIWAWSKKRKPDFDEAARLPLEEDAVLPDVRSDDKE